jgi:rhodanese-related sulfurtransferase
MRSVRRQSVSKSNACAPNPNKAGEAMEVTRVTVDEVKERMDRGEQFAFVDTRNPTAWGEADRKLPGAIRVPADDAEQHLDEIPRDRTVITYCT